MSLTTDPNDPKLGHGADTEPQDQNEVYLVLADEELLKGYIRPYRNKYIHRTCGVETVMGDKLSMTYARDPYFYGATYCVGCRMHKPVAEFKWSVDGETVGS